MILDPTSSYVLRQLLNIERDYAKRLHIPEIPNSDKIVSLLEKSFTFQNRDTELTSLSGIIKNSIVNNIRNNIVNNVNVTADISNPYNVGSVITDALIGFFSNPTNIKFIEEQKRKFGL